MSTYWTVYLKSGWVCIGVALANLALHRWLTPWIKDSSLRWAIVLCLLQVVVIVVGASWVFARRAYNRYQAELYEQIRPAIEERVMSFALGAEAWSTAVPAGGPARHVLEQCLAHALVSLKESGRERLAQFASQHGFTQNWIAAFHGRSLEARKRAVSVLGFVAGSEAGSVIQLALRDRHLEIRTEAAKALLVAGDSENVDLVFRSVLKECRLTRALLTSDLKRHARYLLARTVPAVLAGNNHLDTRNCLELLTVWKLANPGLDIAPLLDRHRDGSVLPLVVELLPYVTVEDSIEDRLQSALQSVDLDVQCAAARASGQLKLSRLIPALVESLHQNRRLALAAATALAQMGAHGARHLELIVRGKDRNAAAVAMEALETITVGA